MKITVRLLILAVPLVLSFSAEQAGAAVNEDRGSVGIVSSVNGEARIAHPTGTQQPDQPKFRGPIIYGDHLSTGKDSTLGLLVGQNSLLTMRELSEVRIAETVRNRQILEVAKGKVCLAVSRPGDTGTGPFTVRTPTSMITAAAGTLLSVDVETAPQKSHLQQGMSGGVGTLVALAVPVATQGMASAVETYHVVEGSIDIVSLAPGPSPISLRSGQSLRVTGGVRGQPFVAPPVTCRAQEIQIIPVHTNTPAPAQKMIVQQQMQIVGAERVAAMAQVSGAVLSGGTIPGGIYVPFSNDKSLVPTTRTTIQVRLP
jgi:hypothetical protein